MDSIAITTKGCALLAFITVTLSAMVYSFDIYLSQSCRFTVPSDTQYMVYTLMATISPLCLPRSA